MCSRRHRILVSCPPGRAVLVLGLLAVNACRDATQPTGGSPPPQPNPPALQLSSGDPLPSLTGTLSPTSSSINLGPNSIGSYPEPTLADVRVAGVLERYNSNWYGHYSQKGADLGPWDALGGYSANLGGCSGNVEVRGSLEGVAPFCDYLNQLPLQSDYTVATVLRGTINMRWARGPAIFDSCDGAQPPAEPCFVYTGSHTVTVTPVEAQLGLTVRSGTSVVEGTDLVFDASVTPATYKTRNVPWRITDWRWVPDDPSDTRTVESCYIGYVVCQFRAYRSGTMVLEGYANGAFRTTELRIEVSQVHPVLTATPSSVRSGDTVTFAVTVAPAPPAGWGISSWVWTPDSGTGGIGGGCGTPPTCKKTITKSGTMKVWVSISGRPDSATVRVRVIPCPTADSLANMQDVREAMSNALNASNPTDPNTFNRVEHGGLIVKERTSGRIFGIPLDLPGATNCGVPNPLPLDVSQYQILGSFHTHPYRIFEQYRCIDPVTGDTSAVRTAGPGGSRDDEAALDQMNQALGSGGQPAIDEYVIDRDFVYRLNHGDKSSSTLGKWSACPAWLN